MAFTPGSGAVISFTVDGASTAQRKIESIGNSMGELSTAAKSSLKELAAFAGVGLSLGALAEQVLSSQREFDKLNASLVTATGSTADAAKAFKALQSFASTTPFSVAEATEAFIKMRNLGLDPSEKSLRSYGNTASAMGKGLDQMIEAVADAATGEFERLKEFGIKAKQNGDFVILTFKGVTTSVGNNAKDIQNYLRNIGETDFGSGMALRAATLDGAISNLGDTWESVMRGISSNGIGDAMLSGVQGLSAALQDLGAILDAVGGSAEKEGKAVSEASTLHKSITTVFEAVAVLGVNVAYVFTQVGKELGGLAAQAAAVARGDFAGAKNIGEQMKVEAEEARAAVEAKSTAILSASKKAQDAQAAELAQAKKNGTDRLAQYATELSADEKRIVAKQAIADLEHRLNGTNAQTASDLKKLKEALDTGAISQKEYNKYTAKIAEDTLKGSTAYKDLTKSLDLASEAIKHQSAVQGVLNDRQKEHIGYLLRIGQINDEMAIKRTADADVESLNDKKAALEGDLALAKRRVDNEKERMALDGQIDVVKRQIAARREKEQEDLFELQQKNYREATNNSADIVEKEMAELAGLKQQTQAQLDYNAQIGFTPKQIAAVTAAYLEMDAARKDAEAIPAEGLDLTGERAERIRAQAAAIRARATAVVDGAAKQELFDKTLQDANALVDIMSALDQAAQSAAQGMAESFGRVGTAIGGLTTALTGYERTQAAIAAQLVAATKDAGGDQTKIQRANALATQQSAQAQIKSYGDMASAAKGFFNQNSTGYKVLQGVEKAYRAAEMVMALESMTKKILFKETEVAANTALNATKLTGEATASAASTGLAATEASAWGVTAVVKAIASMPFPLNLAAGAATLAAVVAVGAKMVGGIGSSSVSVSEQRQAAQGAGTVLGDKSAKSESIARSIELTAANSSTQIDYLSGMLSSLRTIQSNIGSFANQVVRDSSISDPDVGPINTNNGLGTNIVTGGLVALGGMAAAGLTAFTSLAAIAGPLGMAAAFIVTKIPFISNIVGKIGTAIFGGKQSIEDSGFTLDKANLASILANGAKAQTYADIKTSGGWFGSDKTSIQNTALGAEESAQFTLVLKSMADGITSAADLLGVAGSSFDARLSSFVVDIGNVSLKGLNGEEQQKAIEAVFSKLGDQMASYAIGGLQQFQKVGEGYFETLTRVATDYAKIDASMQSIGRDFGATGLQSIAAREGLVSLMGGIDEFQSATAGFAQNFLTKAEQLAPVAKYVNAQLAAMNLSWVDTREEFKQVVLGLDLTTAAGRAQYSTLMQLADAFVATHEAAEDLTKSAQEIADERRDLQDQLDEMTMSSIQLLAKQRDALDESNRALFDQVQALKAVKDLAASALGNVDGSYSVLQKVVGREKAAVQTTIDVHTAAFNKLQSLSQALRSTFDSLKSPDQKLADRAFGQASIRAALAIAKAGGPLPDADSLKSALSAVTQDASSQFGSYQDYLRDLYQTQADIAQLGTVTDSQLSVEQKALDAAKAQLTSLEAILTTAQDQIDVLKGIDTSGLTLVDAMRSLTQAIVGAKDNPIVGATAAINGAYQQYLGRAPDAQGLEWWQNAAASGAPVSQIVEGIKGSTEATLNALYQQVLGRAPDAEGLAFWMRTYGPTMDDDEKADWLKAANRELHPFAVGTNFIPEDMPAMVHKGERIIPAADNRALMARLSSPSGDNAALVAEIKALRETVERQQRALDKIADSTSKHADMFENATGGGGPLLVEVTQ